MRESLIGKNYIGEHKNSELANHLYECSEHRFNWRILGSVPNKIKQEKFMKHIMQCVYSLP